jgi:hypothetical protein
LSNSANFAYRIKDLEKRLLLSKTELLKIKKNEVKKDREINKLKSNLAKLPIKVKALEKKLLLSKTELLKIKNNEVQKDREIIKLKSNSVKLPIKVKALEKELLLSKAELLKIKKTEGDLEAESTIKADAAEKYKGLVGCYRTALLAWDDINRREGLTEQDHLVIRVELRRSISSCPPI